MLLIPGLQVLLLGVAGYCLAAPEALGTPGGAALQGRSVQGRGRSVQGNSGRVTVAPSSTVQDSGSTVQDSTVQDSSRVTVAPSTTLQDSGSTVQDSGSSMQGSTVQGNSRVTVAPSSTVQDSGSTVQGNTLSFLSEGTERLATSIIQSFVENRTNLVFSPFGYSVILAILAEGSRGRTKEQLVEYLRYPQDTYTVRTSFKAALSLMQERNALNQPEFRNYFYVYKSCNCTVEDSYRNVIEDNFLTKIKEAAGDIDMEEGGGKPTVVEPSEEELSPVLQQTATKTSATGGETANHTASAPGAPGGETGNHTTPAPGGETENLTVQEEEAASAATASKGPQSRSALEQEIMSALSANRLSAPASSQQDTDEEEGGEPESRMIVFNALYYRGGWRHNFTLLPGGCEFETGAATGGGVRRAGVPAVQASGEFQFGRLRQLRASAINIPHQTDRYVLTVLLPERGESLDSVSRRLSRSSLSSLDHQLTPRQVKVTLPKFKFHSITRPKAALIKEGLTDVFSGAAADLSGITGERGLYLADLVQLVTIELTEESAAYNFLSTDSVPNVRQSVAEFYGRRPFLYFLRDRIDNYILIAGKVEDPTQES